MYNLDRVMQLDGALAAGEFTLDGELVAYKGELPEDTVRLVARMCAANSQMGITQAELFSRVTDQKWLPFHGWAVSGGDYSVCVVGHICVFVETHKADFNTIFHLLGEITGEDKQAA